MLKFLIEKEFKQIIRNSFIPKMLVFMPIMVMIIMPFAANQELKEVKLSIIDNDHSTYSERLIRKVFSSGYFTLTNVFPTYNEAIKSIEAGQADIILEIPNEFETMLFKEGVSNVMISANSVNGTKGSLGSSYLSSIISDYTEELREETDKIVGAGVSVPMFKISPQYKFNPYLDYKFFMVPALMVMLLTMIIGFLPALNIVGEKETGTIEQINVTPVKKLTFIISKLIPYWIIGFVILTICIGLAALIYRIYPIGSLLTIYAFASIYILVISGMGLIVSSYSDTMQQAMFVMFFFIMILILMSGLFTPVSSMPEWAQKVTIINPLRYFIQVMRLVYLKGSSFSDLIPHFITLSCFAVVFNLWAISSYKKSN